MGKRVFITGDKHGNFSFLEDFCLERHTTEDDVLIILGDAGINYFLDNRDNYIKKLISFYPITLFCIRGNHEERPQNISVYKKEVFFGNEVYVEDEFPNIKFAIDGNLYHICGYNTLVLGGAYSIDKWYRLRRNARWFKDEQLNNDEKIRIEEKLENLADDEIDVILSHTCPYEDRPTDLFLSSFNQNNIDSSMEKWLEKIKHMVNWDFWFCGHFHDDRMIAKNMFMLYNKIIPFDFFLF